MKSRPAAVIIVLLAVTLLTWSITTATAASIIGDHEEFVAWRTDHAKLFYGIWLAEVVVIGLPALWFTGKRMDAYSAQQDQAVLAARGVGRLATAALRGDQNAVRRLIKLLDDAVPAVKYQSARALAMVDDAKSNEELFRKVRYWDVDHKLGLIDVLKRTMDMRTIKLLRALTEDRNPMVARKAKTALTIVSSRSGNIDDFIAKRRKQAQAKTAKAARRRAKAGGNERVAGDGRADGKATRDMASAEAAAQEPAGEMAEEAAA
ncbi:MAG TPA: hypothetical protein PLB30_06085, partial [Thermoleophilia bacterium]|nr:hypothetical protein [Thermoleophilia bacterium]